MQGLLQSKRSDELEKLKEPVIHLQRFVKLLRTIYQHSPSSEEDRIELQDLFPLLSKVSRQTAECVLVSKEFARLWRVASALDFSKFPSIEKVSAAVKCLEAPSSSRTWIGCEHPWRGTHSVLCSSSWGCAKAFTNEPI
jgi:hypothetical protein